jgi:phage terminase small subunit
VAQLTAKQQRFVDEYLVDLNATQAAIRAGYSKKTARQIAKENLTKPYIKAYIDQQLKKLEDERIAEAKEVLQYLTAVMRGETEEEIVGFTEFGVERVRKMPYIKDRVKAAELLAKRYGLLNENMNLTAEMAVKIVDDIDDED